MTATALKKEMHKAIDSIEDADFLQAIYILLNTKRTDYYELTEAQWKEIERRQKLYKSGKLKTYSWEETKKMLSAAVKK